ncbi:MAG: caspase family protein [Pseudonocardia sp.]|nr:MAG: caspase family protein [Pseudonocardia sp.]
MKRATEPAGNARNTVCAALREFESVQALYANPLATVDFRTGNNEDREDNMPTPVPVSRAAPRLTPAELGALRPHVVNLRDGRLATGPDGEGEYFTTANDVTEIFNTHLPNFIERSGSGPVPLVLYAHGGLTPEANGLRTAQRQVQWWLDNGAYPIHFVWETGLNDAIADALAAWLAPTTRGWLDEAKDRIVETVARLGQGKRIWDEMKNDAATAVANGGGGQIFAAALNTYMTKNPGSVSIHAVGHSAGSIFHAHLLPALLAAGVDHVDTVSLLAPAIRADLFKQNLLPELENERIGHLAMFTMTRQAELSDSCNGIYEKSLLYLVSASFEPEIGAPILGLEEDVHADTTLRSLFSDEGTPATVVWSPVTAGPRDSSTARSHGAFDDDAATMDSVARRILGRDEIQSFAHTVGALRQTQPSTHTASLTRQSWPAGSKLKALCVGIDRYPVPTDQLAGCVADALQWATALREIGFDVAELHDKQAHREGILRAMIELVSGANTGDALVIQYAGHGSNIDDLDGDESVGSDPLDRRDEALCPWDFRDGALLIDDDLGRVWDLLPESVDLTLFFDSCHSGSANRGFSADEVRKARADTPPNTHPRYAALDDGTRRKYRDRRGEASRTLERSERELLFSACSDTELAYETDGQGDFTAKAAPLISAAAASATNREFLNRVLSGFGNRQTPEIHGAATLFDQLFLPTATPSPAPTADRIAFPDLVATNGYARNHAVAKLLRATADLLETH